MLRTHYRQPIDWTLRGLEENEKALQRFAALAPASPAQAAPSPELIAALADDLNTAAALAHLHRLAQEARADAAAARQLGVDCAWLGLNLDDVRYDKTTDLPAETRARVEALIAERLEARRAKDWAASDRLRAKIEALGVALKDSKEGTSWEIKR